MEARPALSDRRKLFCISHGLTKVRFAPDAAHDFFQGLDGLVRGIRSGRMTEGAHFAFDIIDFDGAATLVVDFGIASGKPYFRLGDEEIEFYPLARGGRRGGGRGAELARRYREGQRRQDLKQQTRSVPWYARNGIPGEDWWC